MGRPLELVLFENDPDSARRLLNAGISSFLVDLELLGKDFRQLGFDTEIRPGTWDQLNAISSIPGAKTWCRLNRYGDHSRGEIETSIAAGTQVLVLPMVTALNEVEYFVELISQRCQAAIMIETPEALSLAAQFNRLRVDYAFFGLNDFAISRGSGSIFRALCDGSVEAARCALKDVRFGVGGLTDMRRGHPIPSFRLLQELQRLGCDFTFLRRSFRRDSTLASPAEIIHEINRSWLQCESRTEAERRLDHEALVTIVGNIESHA